MGADAYSGQSQSWSMTLRTDFVRGETVRGKWLVQWGQQMEVTPLLVLEENRSWWRCVWHGLVLFRSSLLLLLFPLRPSVMGFCLIFRSSPTSSFVLFCFSTLAQPPDYYFFTLAQPPIFLFLFFLFRSGPASSCFFHSGPTCWVFAFSLWPNLMFSPHSGPTSCFPPTLAQPPGIFPTPSRPPQNHCNGGSVALGIGFTLPPRMSMDLWQPAAHRNLPGGNCSVGQRQHLSQTSRDFGPCQYLFADSLPLHKRDEQEEENPTGRVPDGLVGVALSGLYRPHQLIMQIGWSDSGFWVLVCCNPKTLPFWWYGATIANVALYRPINILQTLQHQLNPAK